MGRFGALKELGLSKAGIDCYVCLLENGPATTRRLAELMGLPQSNLYGSLAKLNEEGFIDKIKITTQPTLFKARPLNKAMGKRYMHQRRLVLKLCSELGVPAPPALPGSH